MSLFGPEARRHHPLRRRQPHRAGLSALSPGGPSGGRDPGPGPQLRPEREHLGRVSGVPEGRTETVSGRNGRISSSSSSGRTTSGWTATDDRRGLREEHPGDRRHLQGIPDEDRRSARRVSWPPSPRSRGDAVPLRPRIRARVTAEINPAVRAVCAEPRGQVSSTTTPCSPAPRTSSPASTRARKAIKPWPPTGMRPSGNGSGGRRAELFLAFSGAGCYDGINRSSS